MCDLMDICNTFHIPVGCFFYVSGTESVTRPTPAFAYEAASFDSVFINELLKGERGKFGVPAYKMMNAAEYEDCRNRKWASDFTRITAYTLVDLCNGMCINMQRSTEAGHHIHEHKVQLPHAEGTKRGQAAQRGADKIDDR